MRSCSPACVRPVSWASAAPRSTPHATLDVRTFDPADLTPAQRYVLMPGVRRILELRDALGRRHLRPRRRRPSAHRGRGDPAHPAGRRALAGARRPHGLADQRRHPPRLRRAPERRRRSTSSPSRARPTRTTRSPPPGRPWSSSRSSRTASRRRRTASRQLQGAVPRLQRGLPGRPGGAQAVESGAPRSLTRKRTVCRRVGAERDEVRVQVRDAAAVEAHVAAALDRGGRERRRAAP